jgi:hypothetical protein
MSPRPGQPSEPASSPPPITPAAPPAGAPSAYLPARVRRLSAAEIAASIAALLPGAAPLPFDLAADVRQGPFTANAAEVVDPLLASQLQDGVGALAAGAAPTLVSRLGCSAGDDCAERFIRDFVSRAWRRPLAADEVADLREVFHAGATGADASFRNGVALVVTAALQSASFLYLTELGDTPARDGRVELAAHETAAALSYLVTGGPPDAPLREAAARGALATGSARAAEVRRLWASEAAKPQVQRFVSEWLGIDRLSTTSKDGAVYPEFESYRPLMQVETDAFIAEVIFHDGGTLARLLSADYTVASPELASFYELASTPGLTGRSPLGRGPRRGLLTQASFLAVHAHPDSSAPVKRGVAILDRLLCAPLPRPSELALSVIPPKPDATRTTRARFAAHAQDPACAGCHALIDPIGDAFEGFDGMGVVRTQENAQPIVTAADLQGPLVGHVDGAAGLIDKLAASAQVSACFARNFFRFAATASDATVEATYLQSVWATLPDDRKDSLLELFASWAASDLFVTRAVSP